MRAFVTIVGIVLIGGLAYFLFTPHTKDLSAGNQASTTPTPQVVIHDTYSKGTHTIKGSIAVANPCTIVSEQVSLTGASTNPSIAVAILATPDSGVCLEQVATTTFTLTISAPKGAPVTASVNGAEAQVLSQ